MRDGSFLPPTRGHVLEFMMSEPKFLESERVFTQESQGYPPRDEYANDLSLRHLRYKHLVRAHPT
jgi:hypothetical protein